MAEQYKKTKIDFDNKMYVYLMKRLFDDIQESDGEYGYYRCNGKYYRNT